MPFFQPPLSLKTLKSPRSTLYLHNESSFAMKSHKNGVSSRNKWVPPSIATSNTVRGAFYNNVKPKNSKMVFDMRDRNNAYKHS